MIGGRHAPLFQALVALLVIVGLGCVFHREGAFFNPATHLSLLRQIAVPGILACGMTVVIVTAGIDLSVGSVLALVAVVFAKLMLHEKWPVGAAVALSLGTGVLAGLINGVLVAACRIQPFIVTLAMMVFARGLAKALSGGKKVTSTLVDETGVAVTQRLPPAFDFLDARVLEGRVAVVTIVLLGCVALTWFVLSALKTGRWIYATGGNAQAARLAGVPVRRVLVLAYALSGLFAAVAGICQAAQETHGDPETGMGYELDAIAMVVLGGTALSGGRGSVLLTLLGALTIGYLQKILSLNEFSTDVRLMLTGAILIAAVMLQRRGAP